MFVKGPSATGDNGCGAVGMIPRAIKISVMKDAFGEYSNFDFNYGSSTNALAHIER
jgi:hypothetical protein